ncbi:MAG: hypothetical protein HY973_00055 [Candidatus Kerfeldbacteria bacterium]|nr:hypothetical protein [Candidatus Kerfeldbacteria bacterium]
MSDLSKVKKCGIIDTLFKPVLANKMTYANSNLTPKQNISGFNTFESTHQVSFRLWWVFCLAVLLVGGLVSFPHKASAVDCTVGLPCTISISVDAQDPEADPIYGVFTASPSSYTILSCSPAGGSNTGSQCTTGQLSTGSGTLSSTYQFSAAISYTAKYEIWDNASHFTSGSVQVNVIADTTPPSINFAPVSRPWSSADISVTPTASDSSGVSYVRHCWTTSPSCDPGTANTSTFTNGSAVSQTADGVWSLCVRARDTQGNWNPSPICTGTYNKDSVVPVCGTWSPTSSPWKTSGTQSFTLSGSTDTGGSGIATAGGTCTTGAINGSTCNVGISDNAGNNLACVSPPNNVDSTSPAVAITSPAAAPAWQNAKNFVVSVSESDAGSGLASCFYYTNGSYQGAHACNSNFSSNCPSEGASACTVTEYATDVAGNTGLASRTFSIDATAPTPSPATGWASAITPTSITWNITASTDGGVGLHSLPYSFDGGTTWQASSSLTTGSLTCGTGYAKSIMTRDALDNRTNVGTLSATTAVCLPGAVTLTGTPANPTTSTAAVFVWQAATNATSYDTYVDSGSYQNVAATNRSITVGAGSHTFSVCGVNASGVGPCTNYSWLIDTTPPSQVTLTLSPNTTSSSFNLSWTAAVDNESGLARYELWRAPDSGGAPGSWNKVKDVASTSTTDNPAAGVYWYGIHAVNNAGGYSTEVAAQKGTKDTTPPTPNPATGSASNIKRNAITWNITAPTDSGVGLHSLPYSFDNGSTWQASNSLTDNGLNCGTQYIKTIVTRDALDNRTTAGSISQYTLDCGISGTVSFTQTPPAFTYQTGATFAWNAVSGATSYLVQLDGGTTEVIVQTTKSYSGLTQGSHTFIITPQNNGGQGTATTYSWTIDLTAPQVNSLSAVVAITNSPPIITWSAIDTGGSAIQKSELWRAPDSGGAPGAWSKIIDSATAPQTDATVSPNVKYWYGLHVLDNAGNCITEGGSHCGGVASDSSDPRAMSSPSGVTYDTETPSLSGLAPLNTISSLRPALTATVTDNLSGVNNSTVTISRAGSQVLQKTFGTVNSLNISGSDWSGPLSNATYTVRVLSNDKAGNQLDQNWTFTVNNLAPNKPNLR